MRALCDTVRWFAGPMGRVGLDVEGVTGGGLQVPDDLLQRHLTDGLLVLHLHWVWSRAREGEKEEVRVEIKSERWKKERHKWGKENEDGGGADIKVMENKIKRRNNKYNLFVSSFYGYCPFQWCYQSSSVR